MNKIIVICGPTASGKTALSINVAKRLDAEIVSADSMQIYKEMNVGTAKPDMIERGGVVHHLFDVVSVADDYNVSRYVSDATACINDIFYRGKNVVLVGGTGMYIDTLINNVDLFDFENDIEYREYLAGIAEQDGPHVLLEKLRKVDPESASRLHENDIKRVIRALEVHKVTGCTLTSLHEKSKRSRIYDPIFVSLNYEERQTLYDRINKRVDIMINNGWLDEARYLEKLDLSSTAAAAIGYKDLFDYLHGEVSLDDAIENIKKKTRNYAKRQLTWFRKNKEIRWFTVENYSCFDDLCGDVINYILEQMR